MTLNYLDFDYSEDTEGIGVFDAMAATAPDQAAAVDAEIALVLDWASASFPDRRGPVGDGGDWDYDLQDMQEGGWRTVTLSISGTREFCAAFSLRFALESGP
ncbi:hypothetical protein J7E70_03650 [Variovorax paradoxus]|nr:hypothetical protein [Variovorax paradoxus]MBT2299553.1 hypothetical protein [Variovorax paradoxus]